MGLTDEREGARVRHGFRMTARAPLPDGLGPHFSTRIAVDAGATPSRMRALDLERTFHGIRSVSLPEEDWSIEMLRRMAAYAARMPESAFFVRAAALLAAGLPVPRSLRRTLEVAVGVAHPGRAPKGRGVLGVSLRPHLVEVERRGAFRVTTAPTTWASLAARLPHRDLVAIADAIVRVERMPGTERILRPPLAGIDDLRAVIERGQWRGRMRLRAAIEDVRTGSASMPETHLRLAVVGSGLPEPALDVDVHDRNGAFLGCSELAYPRLRIALEYEGDHHRTERRQWYRDLDKYAAYAEAGWTVVRIAAAHLYPSPAPAVARVTAALRGRAG